MLDRPWGMRIRNIRLSQTQIGFIHHTLEQILCRSRTCFLASYFTFGSNSIQLSYIFWGSTFTLHTLWRSRYFAPHSFVMLKVVQNVQSLGICSGICIYSQTIHYMSVYLEIVRSRVFASCKCFGTGSTYIQYTWRWLYIYFVIVYQMNLKLTIKSVQRRRQLSYPMIAIRSSRQNYRQLNNQFAVTIVSLM